eukprot:4136216-Pleurochrysis_carterae.AAC.2
MLARGRSLTPVPTSHSIFSGAFISPRQPAASASRIPPTRSGPTKIITEPIDLCAHTKYKCTKLVCSFNCTRLFASTALHATLQCNTSRTNLAQTSKTATFLGGWYAAAAKNAAMSACKLLGPPRAHLKMHSVA